MTLLLTQAPCLSQVSDLKRQLADAKASQVRLKAAEQSATAQLSAGQARLAQAAAANEQLQFLVDEAHAKQEELQQKLKQVGRRVIACHV